MFVILTHFRIL